MRRREVCLLPFSGVGHGNRGQHGFLRRCVLACHYYTTICKLLSVTMAHTRCHATLLGAVSAMAILSNPLPPAAGHPPPSASYCPAPGMLPCSVAFPNHLVSLCLPPPPPVVHCR